MGSPRLVIGGLLIAIAAGCSDGSGDMPAPSNGASERASAPASAAEAPLTLSGQDPHLGVGQLQIPALPQLADHVSERREMRHLE